MTQEPVVVLDNGGANCKIGMAGQAEAPKYVSESSRTCSVLIGRQPRVWPVRCISHRAARGATKS